MDKDMVEGKYSSKNEDVVKPEPDWVFKLISIIHDNPLLSIFRNPYKLLKAAGLKTGQKVLEVGCGPGFFTIPAAKIVGDEGVVYAIDIHPLAIKKVKEKVKKYRVTNVKPILANASNTKLPSQSIDLAFIFGLHYVAGGLENVISEMYRVLRTDGILAFEKTRGSEKEIIKLIEEKGFVYLEKRGRILIFTRRKMKV